MSNLTNHELEHIRKFKVMITEMLKQMVKVEADDPHEAEQMVSDGWQSTSTFLVLKTSLTRSSRQHLYQILWDSCSTNDRYWN